MAAATNGGERGECGEGSKDGLETGALGRGNSANTKEAGGRGSSGNTKEVGRRSKQEKKQVVVYVLRSTNTGRESYVRIAAW